MRKGSVAALTGLVVRGDGGRGDRMMAMNTARTVLVATLAASAAFVLFPLYSRWLKGKLGRPSDDGGGREEGSRR